MLRIFKNNSHTRIYNNLMKQSKLANQDRVSISESFKKYVKEVIPTYEAAIETRIINAMYHRMPTQALKTQLLNAYKRRQLDMIFRAEEAQIITATPDNPSPPVELKLDPFATNIATINFTEVGCVYDFGLDDFIKYFPRMNFGNNDYIQKNMQHSMNFSVQVTPEAFSAIELLRLHDRLHKTSFDSFEPNELLKRVKDKSDLDLIYKDREFFLKLIFTFGQDFRNALNEKRFDEKPFYMFANSFMFDYLLMVMAWQMYRPEVREIMLDAAARKKAFEYILQQILEHPESHYYVPHEFKSFIEIQKQFFLNETVKVDLSSIGDDYKRLPSALQNYLLPNFIGLNSNLLFWGVGGAGKSGNMYAITMWAIKSNWLVFKLPSVRAVTHSSFERVEFHDKSRLFMTQNIAHELLKEILSTNEHLLSEIPVDLSIYGNYNMVGVHKDEPNPVPNFYIPDRKTYFYDADKFYKKGERETRRKHQIVYDSTVGERIPNPQSLMEIAKFGIDNPLYATNCIAELLEQAYNCESHNVLVAVDDYNWFYRPSATYGFMYENIRGMNSKIPPYHMALCRLFLKFDGHRIKRGFKVAGTSNYSISKHYFEPKKINFPREFCHEIHGIKLEHLPYFVKYASGVNIDIVSNQDDKHLRQLWMETQGNYGSLVRNMRHPEFRAF
jgi:hypothetical protein